MRVVRPVSTCNSEQWPAGKWSHEEKNGSTGHFVIPAKFVIPAEAGIQNGTMHPHPLRARYSVALSLPREREKRSSLHPLRARFSVALNLSASVGERNGRLKGGHANLCHAAGRLHMPTQASAWHPTPRFGSRRCIAPVASAWATRAQVDGTFVANGWATRTQMNGTSGATDGSLGAIGRDIRCTWREHAGTLFSPQVGRKKMAAVARM